MRFQPHLSHSLIELAKEIEIQIKTKNMYEQTYEN